MEDVAETGVRRDRDQHHRRRVRPGLARWTHSLDFLADFPGRKALDVNVMALESLEPLALVVDSLESLVGLASRKDTDEIDAKLGKRAFDPFGTRGERIVLK